MGRLRFVAWRGLDGCRAEAARVELEADRLQASGTQIGAYPLPYRLDYVLETGKAFVTARLRVDVEGDDWSRRLVLERDPGGTWSCSAHASGSADLPAPGGELATVAGALDCDLGLCPLTNTMPILRHDLHRVAGEHDFLMAWVAMPELTVVPSRQRYVTVLPAPDRERAVVGYRSGSFKSDLLIDDDGLVVDYPQLARRVRAD